MPTHQDIYDALDDEADLITAGYDFEELDRAGYLLWTIECAEHVLPACRDHVPEEDFQALQQALASARGCVEHTVLGENVDAELLPIKRRVLRVGENYEKAHEGSMLVDLMEVLSAIEYTIDMQLSDGDKTYFEDVVSAAARAAYYADLHEDDEEEDEESLRERSWQIEALKRHLGEPKG